MASKSGSKDGGVQKVLLKQVETKQECSCELDIDPDTVVTSQGGGQVLQDASFGVVQDCIESDPGLNDEERQTLHFVPERLEGEEVVEVPSEEPVDVLVKALKKYANEVETKVRRDPQVQKATKQIVSSCVKRTESGVDETDSGGHLTIDSSRLWSYISQVFQIFCKDLENPDVDAITILVNLGTALGYCYYLIKHIVLTYLEYTTFKDVVKITCTVISYLFRHLFIIHFGDILQKIGGWNSLLTTSMVDQGTRAVVNRVAEYVPREYIFLAVGVASITIFVYMKFFKR